MTSTLSRKEIFEEWVKTPKIHRKDVLLTLIMVRYGLQDIPEDVKAHLKANINIICFKLGEKWIKSGRHRDRFLTSNSVWLDEPYVLPQSVQPKSCEKAGRKPKNFDDCSEKSKKRKIQSLLDSTDHREIIKASEIVFRKMGKRDSARVLKDLSEASSSKGTEVKKICKRFSSEPVPLGSLSPDEALSLMVDANLSKHQYDVIRQKVNAKCKNLFPSYTNVQKAKKKCYPAETEITEMHAKSSLQSLVNHTVERLCLAQKEVLLGIDELKTDENRLNILIKWGCDGAQQKQYKQKFSSEEGHTDESLFSISMVPIQMNFSSTQRKIIVWQNPAPSSTRYCRPIKFVFAKESTELISQEVNLVQQEIRDLSPTLIRNGEQSFLVESTFMLTMIDGKICTALSSVTSSSQTCFICGAKPSELNKPSVILNKIVDERSLTFGMSPLHSWIRFMECVLHIAYKLPIMTWQARGPENKAKVAEVKKNIQQRFRKDMGLLVDMPTQQGGNTNDGNTSRRFFRAAEKSSEITGVNKELIERFHIILETLGSGYPIDEDAFESFIVVTRNLYLNEYPWYIMPVSVHKILFHGKDIIRSCILPIGQLSEEAQEARNKDTRKFRELFTRKTSRIDTNTDLFNRLLISSDPFIASLRHTPFRVGGLITKEVLSLLSVDAFEEEESFNDAYESE